MATNDEVGVLLPSVSFSLAAIVRRRQQKQQSQSQPQQYVLVHEKPPRGWWLPGGGVEYYDETPVHAAIRESVEEAGSPSLLPLMQSANSNKDETKQLQLLPSMTHLISLEQSPGRIRFIFRGEWIDDCNDNSEVEQRSASKEPKTILKCPPGDEDSIEAKWMTYDEVPRFGESKRAARNKSPLLLLSDPWLRGHEPITFFGMLELSGLKNRFIPGLPVHTMNLDPDKQDDHQEEHVTGAFFGRMPMPSPDQSNEAIGLTFHGRAALVTHLKCRLLVYNETQQTFAIDTTTKKFPASFVHNQDEMTLKQLVDKMISDLVPHSFENNRGNEERYQVGLLRADHVIHCNAREATLTVFPFVCLCTTDEVNLRESASETVRWVSAEELCDPLERKLADAIISDQSRETYLHLDILRDNEGPKVVQLDDLDDDNGSDVGDISTTPPKDAFLERIWAQHDLSD